MTGDEIRKLCNELENIYPDGGYASRATLFDRAVGEGKITEQDRKEAREFYGSLWTYVGD